MSEKKEIGLQIPLHSFSRYTYVRNEESFSSNSSPSSRTRLAFYERWLGHKTLQKLNRVEEKKLRNKGRCNMYKQIDMVKDILKY